MNSPDSIFAWKWLKAIFQNDLFLPVAVFVVFIAAFLLVRGYLPSGDELITLFNGLYAKYGFEILILSAFLEALFIVNLFVPGQVSLALGIIFAKTQNTDLWLIVLGVATGAILGYLVDYLFGFTGVSKIIEKYGFKTHIKEASKIVRNATSLKLSLGFIHPNLASFTSFGCGVVKMNFLKFFSICVFATISATLFWSLLIYTFSDLIIEIIRRYVYFGVVLIIGYSFFKKYQKMKNEPEEAEEET